MKHLLTILFITFSLQSFGQSVTRHPGSSSQLDIWNGSVQYSRAWFPPMSFNPYATHDSVGMLAFDSAYTQTWVYQTRWRKDTIASRYWVDSLFNTFSGGGVTAAQLADSMTICRDSFNAIRADLADAGINDTARFLDSLQAHWTAIQGKQPSGTYLVPGDTTNKWVPIGDSVDVTGYATNYKLQGYKLNTDSTAQSGYVTHYQDDTERTRVTNAIAGKVSFTDTATMLAGYPKLASSNTFIGATNTFSAIRAASFAWGIIPSLASHKYRNQLGVNADGTGYAWIRDTIGSDGFLLQKVGGAWVSTFGQGTNIITDYAGSTLPHRSVTDGTYTTSLYPAWVSFQTGSNLNVIAASYFASAIVDSILHGGYILTAAGDTGASNGFQIATVPYVLAHAGGGGTVTSVTVNPTTGTGVTASVSNPTTTPSITIANDTSIVATRSRVQKGIDSIKGNFYPNSNPNGYTSNTGTVTNVATNTGTGITGGPITGTGTIAADTSILATRLRVQKAIDSLNAVIGTKGTGSVTSVATGNGLSGGTITTSGTVTADTAILATRLRVQKAVDSLNALIAGKGTGSVTSVAAGYGTSFTSITTTGSVIVDTAAMATRARVQKAVDSLNAIIAGKGTVSSVSAGYGTTFTTITATGSVIVDTAAMATRARVQKAVDSLNAIIATKGSGTVTSVTGTANQIASTGGTTPVLSLVSGGTLPGAWALGTPASMVGTNITGTASGLTAGNVTTNANLTGDVTSVGNATTIGSLKVATGMIQANAVTLTKMDASTATARKALLSQSSASPIWSTETWAVPSTSGNVMTSDGTNWVNTIAYNSANSASTIVQRDANNNCFSNDFSLPVTTIVTAASTTTLTVSSNVDNRITGSTPGKIIKLPATNTLTVGKLYTFKNLSSVAVTFQSTDATAFSPTLAAGQTAQFQCNAITNAAGVGEWDYYSGANTATYTFSTGLTNTAGTVTVNTSQNIATLSNLTTNGIMYVTGGGGTLNSGPLTGDITSSGVATTLATVATAGTTGDANNIPVVTINVKGLTTGITTVANTGGWSVFTVSGSDATTTGTSLVDVTGLVTGTLNISKQYEFEANLDVLTSTGTNGTEYGVNVTVSPTRIHAQFVGNTSATATTTTTVVANNTASTAFLTTASQDGIVTIKGHFLTAGSGSPVFSIRHLKVTSGTSTVKVGSILRVRQIN